MSKTLAADDYHTKTYKAGVAIPSGNKHFPDFKLGEGGNIVVQWQWHSYYVVDIRWHQAVEELQNQLLGPFHRTYSSSPEIGF